MVLAHALVTAPGSTPERFALLLHGLLGQGANLQGVARRLVEARPDWGAVLVDLPAHGESRASAPPHSLSGAATHVRETLSALPQRVAAVVGHSFGGKVALSLLADPPPGLRELWVLDASPSARVVREEGDTTTQVIAALRALPARIASRAQFGEVLVGRGIDSALVLWLAKNLERDGDAFRFKLDLDAIAALLADYDRTDAWPLIESAPAGVAIRFVTGGRSQSLSQADRDRLAELSRRGKLASFELAAAGHFLHVDDPEGLLRVLAAHLSR
jgi:esterase